MKNIGKKIIILAIVMMLVLSTNAIAIKISNEQKISEKINQAGLEDLDPNADIKVTVSIKQIRALDEFEKLNGPDFYVKIFICDNEFQSQIWNDEKYLYGDPYLFQATENIPDYMENVSIKIQLWDHQIGFDRLCDLSDSLYESYPQTYDIDLIYNTKTGSWDGDDYNYPHSIYADESGYGRVNGCDDNSIYENDRDCELYFDITQTDTDGDGIPYWTEVNIFETDPMVNDSGRDDDGDGVPIEWEHKWGHYIGYDWHEDKVEYIWYFDPFKYENHSQMDFDEDGLNNVEEFMMAKWGSDPFRQDIYLEMDQMEAGPKGEPASIMPEGAKELLKDPFHRRNIVYHIDTGQMGGGEMIPFMESIEWSREGMDEIYDEYFLHGDEDNWRRGVFFYGSILYDAGFQGYNYRSGAFQISLKCIRDSQKFALTFYGEDMAFASVFMHEHGHALGLNHIYGHDTDSYYPWQINWWKYRPYKSCMNYGYTYVLVDYSDGSRGKNDMDDWGTIDLTLFQEDGD